MSESSPYVEVTVVKQGSSDVNVTVLLSTVDGTAIGKYHLGDPSFLGKRRKGDRRETTA